MKSSCSLRRRFARRTSLALVGLLGGWTACFVASHTPALAADPPATPTSPDGWAEAVLRQVGSPRGLCVVLGDAECDVAVTLARRTELTIYLQRPDAAGVEASRRKVDAAGFYGSRIYVEQGPLDRLHLAANLADAVVVLANNPPVPLEEVLRVLRPQGRAWIDGTELTKPTPQGVDDWTHPYHGPDNNPASNDEIARAPYLTQFLADPRYAPLPQVAVTAAGRVFKVFGHIAFKEREEPWLNTLAAFNGYNGAFLWRREIPPGLMVHRNTLIATPTEVYFADDKSCKVVDAASGKLKRELVVPADVAGGTFWKWMALEDGVLYALVGEAEQQDPVIRMRSDRHGWPWDPLSPGFNQPEHPWGYGRTLFALDPASGKVLWRHQEAQALDSRALCLSHGRLFLFRHGAYLACLETSTGRELWRKTPDSAPALFEALGAYLPRQDWRTNWRTTAYAKCSERALYFAGPTIGRLVAVSTQNGDILWQHPYGNYQLVLQADALYALSGQIDTEVSRKFEPLTGKVLEEIKLGRRACTRPTGAIDAIFCRASGGSTRLDLDGPDFQLVSPMRAQCQDGVTVANGLLYWWPSVCDCNLTLYGITCLGPAGDFDFAQPAREAERLEAGLPGAFTPDLTPTPTDWPTFRANPTATVTTEALVPDQTSLAWECKPPTVTTPTAPTTAGGRVFLGGADGIVRALDAATGKPAWTAYTGGGVRFPPTIAEGRAFVGSGDGWAYAFAARSGRLLWRFRAAPIERRIPVYGQLLSTWPAASGVLVHDGVAYVAAGIVNYDGTHVYALDAATGRLKWQNNTSGHLDPAALAGVSVQGHLMLHDGKLAMAGGNVVSPAFYDLADGHCLNDPALAHRLVNNNVPSSESPRGSELYQIGGRVMVSGQPFYAHPVYKVYDGSVFNKTLLASAGDRDLTWVNNAKVLCYPRVTADRERRFVESWGKPTLRDAKPLWEADCPDSAALAVTRNAVVVARKTELVAYNLTDGRRLWTQALPAPPVPWGLAVDRDGTSIVTLEGGRVLAFGQAKLVATR